MAVPFSNTKLRVPRGFQNILWVLSKEVLRDAPGDLIEYSANFFQKLLQIRNIIGHDPAQHGAHSEDRFYNNFVFKEASPVNTNVLSEEVQVQKAETPKSAEQVDETTATGNTQPIEGETAEKPTDVGGSSLEDCIDLNDPATQEAAVKIQAQFRGHLARKS